MSSWDTNLWSNFYDPHWRNKWHEGTSEISAPTEMFITVLQTNKILSVYTKKKNQENLILRMKHRFAKSFSEDIFNGYIKNLCISVCSCVFVRVCACMCARVSVCVLVSRKQFPNKRVLIKTFWVKFIIIRSTFFSFLMMENDVND